MQGQHNYFPPKVPLKEWLWCQLRLAKNAMETFQYYRNRLGRAFQMRVGFKNVMVISEPEIIKYILQTNNKNYRKARATQILGEVIGQGLLTSEGEVWLRQRRLIQPAFHRNKLAELTKIMILESQQWIKELEQKTGQNINFSRETMNVTLSIVCKSLFSSAIALESLDKIENAIRSLSEYVILRVRKPIHLFFLRLSGQMGFYKKQSGLLDEIVYNIIEQRKKEQKNYVDLLGMMMETIDEETGEKAFTDKQLRDETMILFLAGHETSANALAWAVFLISQHPEIEQKMLQEFAEVLDKQELSFENVQKLTYTEQVIKEVLRLYPPAWVMSRESLSGDQIQRLKVPKGMYLYLFIYGVHHDPEFWPLPEKFDPERFNKENEKKELPFSYFPFGGGPRLCIGNNFAMLEMKVVLALLLMNFRFQVKNGSSVLPEPLITLRPKGGIILQMIKR